MEAEQPPPNFSLGPESDAFSCPLSNGNKLTVIFRSRRIAVADLAKVREFMEFVVRDLAMPLSEPPGRMRVGLPSDEQLAKAGHGMEARIKALQFRTGRRG